MEYAAILRPVVLSRKLNPTKLIQALVGALFSTFTNRTRPSFFSEPGVVNLKSESFGLPTTPPLVLRRSGAPNSFSSNYMRYSILCTGDLPHNKTSTTRIYNIRSHLLPPPPAASIPSHNWKTQVWKHHRRIKYYFGLTVVAIVVDLAIGVGGILYLLTDEQARIIATTWTMRHVHIALDTLVLYSALGASRFELESSQGDGMSSEEGQTSRLPKRSGGSSSNGKRRKGGSSSVHNHNSPSV